MPYNDRVTASTLYQPTIRRGFPRNRWRVGLALVVGLLSLAWLQATHLHHEEDTHDDDAHIELCQLCAQVNAPGAGTANQAPPALFILWSVIALPLVEVSVGRSASVAYFARGPPRA